MKKLTTIFTAILFLMATAVSAQTVWTSSKSGLYDFSAPDATLFTVTGSGCPLIINIAAGTKVNLTNWPDSDISGAGCAVELVVDGFSQFTGTNTISATNNLKITANAGGSMTINGTMTANGTLTLDSKGGAIATSSTASLTTNGTFSAEADGVGASINLAGTMTVNSHYRLSSTNGASIASTANLTITNPVKVGVYATGGSITWGGTKDVAGFVDIQATDAKMAIEGTNTFRENVSMKASGTAALIVRGTNNFEKNLAVETAGTASMALEGTTRVKGTFDAKIAAGTKMYVRNALTIDGKAQWEVAGDLDVEGTLDMKDKTSTLNVLATGKVRVLSGALMKIGLVSIAGVKEFTGPYVISESNLPIELVRFTAEATGNKVVVSWTTAMEDGVSHYELMRSVDGENFEIIHTIGDIEDSYELKNYAHVDYTAPKADIIYYQLKNVDLDGAFMLSEIVSVEREVADVETTVYPNPVADQLNIDTEVDGTAVIYNINGTKMMEKDVFVGNNEINVSQLSAGIYMLQFTNELNQTSTQRLIVQ